MLFNIDTKPPKNVAELLELISSLKSRKTIYQTLMTHMRVAYQKSDSGPAEMRMSRDDQAFVSEAHIEQTLVEIEERINYIDAQIEELQDQPVGGGTPPATEAAAPAAATKQETTTSEKQEQAGAQPATVLPLAGPSVTTEKKEPTSGKPPRNRPS